MRLIARFFGFIFATGAILFVIGACVAAFMVGKYQPDLPDYTQLKNYEPPVMTRVHASDGSILAEYARERRLYLPGAAIPALVKQAFISAEDKNFYSHNGVDPEGILRAALILVQGSKHVQGASTITQQVAKNFLLGNERTFERKIREALLSFRIEAAYSKEKILELYLNEIYLGLGNYGVAAAALNYYGKSVHELTIGETAYLAALPKAPSNYHPFQKRERALERRNYVIDRMVENNYISRADGEKAKSEALGVNPRVLSPNTYVAGYFAEEVRRELGDKYGDKKLYEGGLSVRTTLDPKMQVLARKALVDGLVRFDEAHGFRGAMRHLDISADWGLPLADVPNLGDVKPWRLAVVLDANDSTARVGLQPGREKSGDVSRERETALLTQDGIKWARRPMRSLFVPGDVVYVEPMADKPGQVRLRQIPDISGAIVVMDPYTGRVFAMVGGFSFDQSEFNRATQALRQPGSAFKPFVYATALDNGYTPSSILLDEAIEIDQGNGETTVLKMVTGYSMFANGGRRIKATLIDRIQDRWGHTIYRHDERACQGCDAPKWANQTEPKLIDKREQVLDPLTAYQITSIMEGVIQRGTGQSIRSVGKHLAGKTGTTNEAKDLWFVGFSPDLAAGVFIGYDRPRSLGDSAQAATYAAPIFRDFMTMALKDKADVPFRVPPGIKLVSIDPKSGMRSSGAGTILEAFKPGTAPPDSYAGDASPRALSGMGDADRMIGSGTGGLY